MSKGKGLTAFGIASTYVGAIIGAGYASGQEILQFFNSFYEKGLIGIVLGTVLFIVAAYVPMMLGKKLNTGDYDEAVAFGKTSFVKIFSDIVITFTLFSTLVIMIAASGSTFNQQFGLPLLVGGLIMCVLCVVSLVGGLDSIVKALSYVVPVMVIGAFGTAFYFIANPAPVVDATAEIAVNSSPLIKHWSLSGPLYVAFNYVVAIGVLISLGYQAKDLKAIRNGAISGGLILGLCALALYTALAGNLHVIGTSDLPLVDLANTLSPTFGSAYSLILFAGLYSTAISCFFGVYQRFGKIPAISKFGNTTISIGIAGVGLIASMVGFSNLIGYVYPAIGYCGLLILTVNTIKNAQLGKLEEAEVEQLDKKLVAKKNFR